MGIDAKVIFICKSYNKKIKRIGKRKSSQKAKGLVEVKGLKKSKSNGKSKARNQKSFFLKLKLIKSKSDKA